MFDKELLKQYVEKYKENINDWRFDKQREIYKWEAVEHFKKYWDIDAPNFAEMLKEALGKTKSLLATGVSYPRKMLLGYAEREPENIRLMFQYLYDESKDLKERVSNFISESNELLKRNPVGKTIIKI